MKGSFKLGKIGTAFARIMHGFGCKIIAFDIEENKELRNELPIFYKTLEEVYALSDVLSIHAFWNDSSKYMFDKNTFSLFKKGMILINTADGKLVNTEDLIEAIDNKILAAVGLDVYEKEDSIFFQDHTEAPITDTLSLKLRSYPNVMITGHRGFLTNETLAGIAHTTIANLNAWTYNGISENEIS